MLALGSVLALGTGVILSTPLYAQTSSQTPANSNQSRSNYSLYGGPASQSPSQSRPKGTETPSYGPVYKMYGVPDDIAAMDAAREARRNAAVEFGMFRRQFKGSTYFWMDVDRTQLARARYAMDEPMWEGIHPGYEFGDGGYMYNTAAIPASPGAQSATGATVGPPATPAVPVPPHVVPRAQVPPQAIKPMPNTTAVVAPPAGIESQTGGGAISGR